MHFSELICAKGNERNSIDCTERMEQTNNNEEKNPQNCNQSVYGMTGNWIAECDEHVSIEHVLRRSETFDDD